MLENTGIFYEASRSMICELLYDDPSFEPSMPANIIRVVCVSTAVFIAYKAYEFVSNDSERYERIYSNISNVAGYKGFLMIAIATISLITGPASILKSIWRW